MQASRRARASAPPGHGIDCHRPRLVARHGDGLGGAALGDAEAAGAALLHRLEHRVRPLLELALNLLLPRLLRRHAPAARRGPGSLQALRRTHLAHL